MRILFITTVGGTMTFFKDLVKRIKNEGHMVDVACNYAFSPIDDFFKKLHCKIYKLPCSRSLFSLGNIKAIMDIRNIVKNGNYDIVHCHTPIAAACARIACRKFRKNGLRVIYTAHGFHFYKGAPLKNWLIFYPIEKLCARFTDTLITINKEDYALAKRRFKVKQVEYVPGVGVDTEKFANTIVDKKKKREELGVPQDAFLLLSVGELNVNKNHQVVIRAMAELENKNVHYIIAGQGNQHDNLLKLASELSLSDRVHLLGRRTDVAELCKTCDVFMFPSIREGLGLAAIEAMSCGVPCIASSNRGTKEYIDEKFDCLCNFNDSLDFAKKINMLMYNKKKHVEISNHNYSVAKKFNVNLINDLMLQIYNIDCVEVKKL